jgi:prepilin signal peptidase PulO-like enzyme (type II secretory pathway)
MGWFLGLYGGLSALLLAFWSGALVAIVILFHNNIIGKRTGLTLKSEIPFAPFLVLGTALAFFLDLSVLQFLLF